MKLGYVLSTAAALAFSVSAMAADDKGQTADKPKEKKICHTEHVTGSLTQVNRVCMTEEQWRQINQKSSKDVSDIVTQSRFVSNGNNPGPGG